MGTNYYLYSNGVCPHCNSALQNNPRHIGKNSGGWCFSLHIYPEEGIHTLEDWKKLWHQYPSGIKDEYGNVISTTELEEIITERSWQGDFPLRSEIDGVHCIGHGSGTWDYIVGDFT
jgi:hypothetical protein